MAAPQRAKGVIARAVHAGAAKGNGPTAETLDRLDQVVPSIKVVLD